MLLQVRRILWKDLKLEARNLPELGGAAIFSVASSSLLGFSLSRLPVRDPLPLAGTGLVLIALFLSVFTSVMTVVREEDLGTLDGVRMSPIEPVTFFLAKLLLTFFLLEILITLSFLTTVGLSGWTEGAIYLYSLVASSGVYLASISALSSAISVYLRARGVLLPTMILVLSLPIIQETLSFLTSWDYSRAVILALSGLLFSLIASWLAGYILEV